MSKSISEEQYSNRFKLDKMEDLRVTDKSEHSKGSGRTSLISIPPPRIHALNPFNKSDEVKKEKSGENVLNKSDNLCDLLCNSYKFVVNYGRFEPNFEWLPHEVS
jgi:hypothetical protein